METERRAIGPTGMAKVFQVHPTRRCNLSCLHCYSKSGPRESEALDIDLLANAVGDAARQGYTVLGVSGGEPILYNPLPELLERAQGAGMITTVTSNGMLVTERQLERIRPHTSLLAISLDGVPESHDTMRGAPRAFESMSRRLASIRASGIPFGFIFTLTQHNVHELQWVLEFALAEGARLLQIHPLEIAGRAVEMLPDSEPDALEMAAAYIEAFRSQASARDRLRVHVDLADTASVLEDPGRTFADAWIDTGQPLSDLVTPLVAQADGLIVPFAYGFPSAFALGNIHETRLGAMSARWRSQSYPTLRVACRRAFDRITRNARAAPIINWYAAVVAEADAMAPPSVA